MLLGTFYSLVQTFFCFKHFLHCSSLHICGTGSQNTADKGGVRNVIHVVHYWNNCQFIGKVYSLLSLIYAFMRLCFASIVKHFNGLHCKKLLEDLGLDWNKRQYCCELWRAELNLHCIWGGSPLGSHPPQIRPVSLFVLPPARDRVDECPWRLHWVF